MASASSLGLPQPPVAVQTASQAGATNAEWSSIPRPTFWNGVANEAVFEKDTAHKGRAMGLASAGTLSLVATPTQTGGIEDTYSKPLNAGTGQATFPASITTKVDTYSFDVSAPVASVIVPNTTPLWASNLTFSRKRARLGGDGAGAVSTTPLFTVSDTAPVGGVNTTTADGIAPTLTFNCPVAFSGGGGGTVVTAVGAPTPLTAAQTSGDLQKQFAVTAAGGFQAPLPNNCNGLQLITGAGQSAPPSVAQAPILQVVSTGVDCGLTIQAKNAGNVNINSDLNVQQKVFFTGTYPDSYWNAGTGEPTVPGGEVQVAGQISLTGAQTLLAIDATSFGPTTLVICSLATLPTSGNPTPYAVCSGTTITFGIYGGSDTALLINYLITKPTND